MSKHREIEVIKNFNQLKLFIRGKDLNISLQEMIKNAKEELINGIYLEKCEFIDNCLSWKKYLTDMDKQFHNDSITTLTLVKLEL